MKILDWELFLDRMDRNESLAIELAQDLLLGVDSRVEKLEFAFAEKIPKPIEQAAHALRGLLAPYGAKELLDILKAIEEQARAGALSFAAVPADIREMVVQLKNELRDKIKPQSLSNSRDTTTEQRF